MFMRNAGNRVSDCVIPYVMCFLWRYAAVCNGGRADAQQLG
jgi:hypothetical protein